MLNQILRIILIAFLLFPSRVFCAEDYSKLSPKEILDKVDDLFRGKSSRGHMTMTITTPHWKRSLALEFWNEGKDKSLIRILAPQKEKGTATLRSGHDLWNFLPKVKRIIKLPSSMMSASWMGSHFSNDDLVKDSRMAEDYTFKTTFEGEKDGKKILEITCIPKPEAAVVWGKVIVRVDKQILMPLYIEYFEEDLHLARTMTFTDYKQFGDRNLPAFVKMVPTAHPDESTAIRYEEIIFNEKFKDELFSLRSLQE